MAQNIPFTSSVNAVTFKFDSWNVLVKKSHILQSRCTNSSICDSKKVDSTCSDVELCDFCRYERELDLPQLPEMTFASNLLRLENDNASGIEFSALDALKMVDSKNDVIKVAVADSWQESRLDDAKIKEVIKPFDWTFTTEYKGTLFGPESSYKVTSTEERINIEKLKVKAKILFYEDVILFEDELADNGIAQLSVKIRIMPDSFFVLMRFFLRVDNLLARIIDTRIYYEKGNSYLLREHMTKESKLENLKVLPALLSNPQELSNHLPIVKTEYEKLEFFI